MAILKVDNLRVSYQSMDKVIKAVNGISFELSAGESFGLVGESGSGKSTAVRGIIRALPDNGRIENGKVIFSGQDLLKLKNKELKKLRWNEIAFVAQAAMDSFNPVYTVLNQFREILRIKGGLSARDAQQKAEELFELVGLDKKILDHYPHEYSGGMKQRALLALALALEPSLLIADEPVTALDVIVQKKILEKLRDLKEKFSLAMILITHDVSVVANICDKIAVMYGGKIMEIGSTRDVLLNTRHPYTLGLKNSFPTMDSNQKKLVSIPGSPPDLSSPLPGCYFAPRCPFAIAKCREQVPELEELKPGRGVACHRQNESDYLRVKAEEVETWLGMTV